MVKHAHEMRHFRKRMTAIIKKKSFSTTRGLILRSFSGSPRSSNHRCYKSSGESSQELFFMFKNMGGHLEIKTQHPKPNIWCKQTRSDYRIDVGVRCQFRDILNPTQYGAVVPIQALPIASQDELDIVSVNPRRPVNKGEGFSHVPGKRNQIKAKVQHLIQVQIEVAQCKIRGQRPARLPTFSKVDPSKAVVVERV
ncbi:hypothetical protein DL546_003414 [Coniochaeta pulveracea]|uniref:Uncharacterized protein n=1 Tax=Coniochaeta pulveracea TaxID=177199 RepID=A0A420Y233_9PEZI|nr:hypothetical protein DL546_003414 [Coniochaeta pulveracea]